MWNNDKVDISHENSTSSLSCIQGYPHLHVGEFFFFYLCREDFKNMNSWDKDSDWLVTTMKSCDFDGFISKFSVLGKNL